MIRNIERDDGGLDRFLEVEALLPWAPTAKKDGSVAGNADSGVSDVDALLAVNRAGTLARELTARGVSAATVAIGIERRLSGSLRLLFVTRTVEAADEPANVIKYRLIVMSKLC